jgi:serine/threonine protein kinase/tetratricopeptide (TPR) repeat protein
MGSDSPCPGPASLQRFALGRAVGEELAAVEEHLKQCEHCHTQVASLKANIDTGATLDLESALDNKRNMLLEEHTQKVAHEDDSPVATVSKVVHTERDNRTHRPERTPHFDSAVTLDPDSPPPLTEADTNQTCEFGRTDVDNTPDHASKPTSPAAVRDTSVCDDSDLLAVTRVPDNEPPQTDKPVPKPAGLEGVVVPGYEILQELGRGGMGVVYKARHLRLRRTVALKMILAGAHAGAAGLARFRAEAEAVAQLQHPNIVQIYETGEHEGRHYFSLEYVEGGSLEDRMKVSPTTPRAAAELVASLARAMDVAHRRGIVHRDLKPANILLGLPSGHSTTIELTPQAVSSASSNSSLASDDWSRTVVPKIADFGLAKRVDDDSSQTQSGAILGTPCYMAPEQAEGKIKEIGPGADIYALGVILYELLTGRPPFKANRPIDTIRQVIDQDPVPPRQLEPRVAHDLETICLKCLEKHPDKRYGTAVELADDLQRFLKDEPILARPTPALERAWKWGKRHPNIVALLAVCVLAVLGVVALIIWHNVSLAGQLEQARADERAAHQREEEALEGQRISRLRHEAQKLYDEARLAVSAHDWANARLQLTKALGMIGTETGLESLKESSDALLAQVEQELRVEAERNKSKARLEKFGKLRDEAQFLGSLYTGMDLAANLKATRSTIDQALAVYQVSLAENTQAKFDEYLDERQKSEIRADCYLLLLILAETEAQSASIQSGTEPEKRLREAVRLLQVAQRFGSPSRGLYMRQARYLSALGDNAGAQSAEKAASEATVLHDFDHFLMADEFYRRGQFEEASKEFNEVLRQKPAHFWAQYLNALCLLRQHRAAEAKAQLSACLAQRTDFVWLYLLRGFALGELQAYDAADADFQSALQLPLDEFAKYVLFVNRGVLRIKQERFQDAIADLTAATKLKPNEYQAYVNLAQAYRLLKQPNTALAQLNKAVELDPTQAHLYRLRARLYAELKNLDLALKDFDQAIARETTDSALHVGDLVERGRVLLLADKQNDALASFDAALAKQKNHSLALRMRAETLFQLGRYAEVIEAFDRYMETGQPLESVYRGRGLARAKLGKYPAAIEDYTKALELKPTSDVYAYRGWAHLVCDAQKLALRDFELAIELDPKNADAYNGRGILLVTQGRKAEAIEDAEKAQKLGTDSPRPVYNAARIYALCGGDKNELRALALIRRTLELLPEYKRSAFWTENIKPDPAMESLRFQPRFEKLLAELLPKK